MLGLELSKELANGSSFSATRFFESLTDALHRIGAGGDVKKVLVRLCILYNGGGWPSHCQHHWALALAQMLHYVARAAAERGERTNIFRDVEHGARAWLLLHENGQVLAVRNQIAFRNQSEAAGFHFFDQVVLIDADMFQGAIAATHRAAPLVILDDHQLAV